jgi:hypothetical protein
MRSTALQDKGSRCALHESADHPPCAPDACCHGPRDDQVQQTVTCHLCSTSTHASSTAPQPPTTTTSPAPLATITPPHTHTPQTPSPSSPHPCQVPVHPRQRADKLREPGRAARLAAAPGASLHQARGARQQRGAPGAGGQGGAGGTDQDQRGRGARAGGGGWF